jgi:hypothetical protein
LPSRLADTFLGWTTSGLTEPSTPTILCAVKMILNPARCQRDYLWNESHEPALSRISMRAGAARSFVHGAPHRPWKDSGIEDS